MLGTCVVELKLTTYHGSDPLTGVDSAVEDNGRLALASLAVDVYSSDVLALERLARTDNFRVGSELLLEVLKPGQVIAIGVVRVKPSGVGRASWAEHVSMRR